MFLYDIRFWSCDENVVVRNTDFRTFRYETKKNQPNSIYSQGKKSYCERRGQNWHIPTSRPLKLKDHLQEIGDHLKDNRIIFCEWHSEQLLYLIFSSGLICYISVTINTGDITRILFDRYFVGKLPASNISGVLFSDTHLLFTYPENQAILASFNQPAVNKVGVEKISNRDPKCQTIELYGSSRKSDRQVSYRKDQISEKVLIWSSATPGEIFPWSPHVRGEDRANVHVYSLKRSKMTLLAFHRIENDPLSVELSKIYDNVVYSVEQKTYQKGTLTVECCTFEISLDSAGAQGLSRRSGAAVSAPAPPRLVSRSPAEDRLLLACIDGSLLLHTLSTSVTQIVKSAFIPSCVCWCGDVLVLGEERGRLQCFDLALQPLPLPPLPPPPVSVAQEDMPYIDVGGYLKKHTNLRSLKWNRCSVVTEGSADGANYSLLLVLFENGPLAVTRIAASHIGLKWLRRGQTNRAISLLRALNWDTEGNTCLNLLQSIVNHLLRSPLNALNESLLQEALGCFHLPLAPLSEHTLTEYGAQLHDLSRKFFHHLVRYGRLDKALSLAVDLADSDLFMDVEYAARNLGETELADEAHSHAMDVVGITEHSTCSLSSCSQCATSSDTGSDADAIPEDNTTLNHQPLSTNNLCPSTQNLTDKLLRTNNKLLENNLHLSQTNHKPLKNHNHPLQMSQKYVQTIPRAPPPLPYVPNIDHKKLISSNAQTIPVILEEITPTNSIRPNLHQYLDRDCSLWRDICQEYNPTTYQTKYNTKPTHHVIDIIPRPLQQNNISQQYNIYQTEIPEETHLNNNLKSWQKSHLNTIPEKNMYKSVYGPKSVLSHRQGPIMSSKLTSNWMNGGKSVPTPSTSTILVNGNSGETKMPNAKTQGEKNKVKFSDTVTIAVVPVSDEIPRKEKNTNPIMLNALMRPLMDPRKELADSLPLCHPNDDYLKDFAPVPTESNNQETSTTKIKVVHFGMV